MHSCNGCIRGSRHDRKSLSHIMKAAYQDGFLWLSFQEKFNHLSQLQIARIRLGSMRLCPLQKNAVHEQSSLKNHF